MEHDPRFMQIVDRKLPYLARCKCGPSSEGTRCLMGSCRGSACTCSGPARCYCKIDDFRTCSGAESLHLPTVVEIIRDRSKRSTSTTTMTMKWQWDVCGDQRALSTTAVQLLRSYLPACSDKQNLYIITMQTTLYVGPAYSGLLFAAANTAATVQGAASHKQ